MLVQMYTDLTRMTLLRITDRLIQCINPLKFTILFFHFVFFVILYFGDFQSFLWWTENEEEWEYTRHLWHERR